jgi:hypothetical protein
VRDSADLVVWLRIRRKLTTALRSSPFLCGSDECPSDTLTPSRRHDEPSLEVRDTVTVAPFSSRTNRKLHETDRTPGPVLRQKHSERFLRLARKELSDFLTVLTLGAVRPEDAA